MSLLAVLLLLTVAGKAHAEDTSEALLGLVRVYNVCSSAQTHESGSAYSKDIMTVLNALEREAPCARYNTSMSGNVIGIYQCRGDRWRRECCECVSEATKFLRDNCPNAIGARVQLDGCFVRYENSSFLREDSTLVSTLFNSQQFTSSAFESHVTQLLSQVITAAPQNKSLYASATSSTPVDVSSSSSSPLYALAQCLGYLSSAECSDCLAAHSRSWLYCDNAVGAQIHSGSCYYRYEIYPFFYQPNQFH